MFAFYLHTLSPFIFKIGNNFGPRWYGCAYVMAFACGYWLYKWLARRGYSEMPAEKVGDFITWAALFGVMLGGRLGYVLFYKFDEYASAPLDIFKLWDGGMSSHGGMLGLILFTLYYARRHHCSWTGIGDNLCVVAPIGLFFGRCANFINGELYGRPSTVPWAMLFPKELYDLRDTSNFYAAFGADANIDTIINQSRHDLGVQEILRGLLTPRHPSQIYEALLEGVVLFCTLWFLRTKMRSPRGVLTGAFFIIYAIVRIIGENFRVPDAPLTGSLTRGQFLSLFLIVIGLAFVIYGLVTCHYEKADLEKKAGASPA
ncbi:MAG: prolipoprotein diacylglyceryl transferase [Chthoniobacteraceae bacterium]